jgi:hypothetical protein
MFNALQHVDNTLLAATLTGFQNKIREMFQLNAFVINISNNPKRAVEIHEGGKPANLPYGWYVPSTLELENERGNLTNMSRFGSATPIANGETSTLKQSYLFPANIPVDLVFRFAEYPEATIFAQRFLLALPAKILNFEINIGSVCDKFTVEINTGGSYSIPYPKIDDVDNANGQYYEISLSVTIKTKIGFLRDVAKLNNYGRIAVQGEV